MQYAILGMWGNAAISGVNAVRSTIFARPGVVAGRRGALVLLFAVVHWTLYLGFTGQPDEWWKWLPLIGATATTVALSLTSVALIKIVMTAAAVTWSVFFAAAGLPVMLVGELIGLVAGIVALRRLSVPACRA